MAFIVLGVWLLNYSFGCTYVYNITEHGKLQVQFSMKSTSLHASSLLNSVLREEDGEQRQVFGAWVTEPASAIRPSGPHIHHWPMAWCSPAFVKTPRGNGVSGPDKNKISLMTKFLLGSQWEKNSAICFHYFPWLQKGGQRVRLSLCACLLGVKGACVYACSHPCKEKERKKTLHRRELFLFPVMCGFNQTYSLVNTALWFQTSAHV